MSEISRSVAERRLPFAKPSAWKMVLDSISGVQSSVTPLLNIVWVLHLIDLEAKSWMGQSALWIVKFVMWASPTAVLASITLLHLEFLARRYLYFRLMENGCILDFKNQALWESKIFWGFLLYMAALMALATDKDNMFLVAMNVGSLILNWQNLLNFEDNLVGLNKFIEGGNLTEQDESQEKFKTATEFLLKCQYVTEDRVRYNAFFQPLPEEGAQVDIGLLADQTDWGKTRRTIPRIYTEQTTFFVLEYFWRRHGRFVDRGVLFLCFFFSAFFRGQPFCGIHSQNSVFDGFCACWIFCMGCR
jgi:hypothetical protein